LGWSLARQRRDLHYLYSQQTAHVSQLKARCQCGCADLDPGASVGICLWCGHRYADYSPKIEAEHFAKHCPEAPEELKETARARLAKT
jgi:hypothetical protein